MCGEARIALAGRIQCRLQFDVEPVAAGLNPQDAKAILAQGRT